MWGPGSGSWVECLEVGAWGLWSGVWGFGLKV